jgi:hypothetical protein
MPGSAPVLAESVTLDPQKAFGGYTWGIGETPAGIALAVSSRGASG